MTVQEPLPISKRRDDRTMKANLTADRRDGGPFRLSSLSSLLDHTTKDENIINDRIEYNDMGDIYE